MGRNEKNGKKPAAGTGRPSRSGPAALLKRAVLAGYTLLAHILPVNRRIIVFQSSLGRDAGGNPRAICDELVRRGENRFFRCYYILNEPEKYRGQLPEGVRPLKNARLKYYFVMAAAGTWVSDTRFQNYMIKRRKTLYLQTWHGTPLKKLGLDLTSLHMAGNESLEEYQREFRENAASWDCLISQNPFSTEIFRRAFGFRGRMLEIGYPRNDILVAARKNAAHAKKSRFAQSLPPGKKVMLYAPTWRDDAFYNAGDYRFETAMDFGKMKEALGGEYVLLVKYHYMVREHTDWNRWPDFVYEAEEGADISELYLLADLLITDYSSAMFDYSLLGRPMYFFAYDLEAYRDELRGFYCDLEKEAPGPVVTTTEELIAAIRGSRGEIPEQYRERFRRFCEKYNPFDDGGASGRAAEVILEHARGGRS
ncbi:MAG: CDP-glycerol glycerophosphotransferase family protein [Lachnospiraceae bacterium]|nr:CDP-glycerol glycerophosphotransferase family protein [Lachnospiraceae bacterium]